MSKGEMINFRLRQEDVPKLDAAAEALGMNRSDFIRTAISEKVRKVRGKTESLKANDGRGKAAPKDGKKFPDCPKNPACNLKRTQIGIQVCTTCGVKRR